MVKMSELSEEELRKEIEKGLEDIENGRFSDFKEFIEDFKKNIVFSCNTNTEEPSHENIKKLSMEANKNTNN